MLVIFFFSDVASIPDEYFDKWGLRNSSLVISFVQFLPNNIIQRTMIFEKQLRGVKLIFSLIAKDLFFTLFFVYHEIWHKSIPYITCDTGDGFINWQMLLFTSDHFRSTKNRKSNFMQHRAVKAEPATPCRITILLAGCPTPCRMSDSLPDV